MKTKLKIIVNLFKIVQLSFSEHFLEIFGIGRHYLFIRYCDAEKGIHVAWKSTF